MPASKPQPFVDPSVETIDLHSEVNGRDYGLRIGLPPSYGQGDERYPVFVVLDGESMFGPAHVTAAGEAMWSRRAMAPAGTKIVPEVIVVGITLPLTQGDFFRRNYEFMPETPRESLPASIARFMEETSANYGSPVRFGGAPDFLEVLRREVLPLVDAQYRTDPSRRVFFGHSAGGTFGCYALFTKPDSFTDYIIVSPGLMGEDMFHREAAWAEGHKALKARVFLSAGEAEAEDPLEIFSRTARLAETLRQRRYEGLTLRTWFIPDANHVQTAAPSISRGLVALLGRD